ncbi:NAD(P)H-binding protein [Paracoccus saliphilus]|uniref:NAD(P)H-binding protein n=1 Tax=Paracoccus saliphilus TaxID=405559 RepID=A0AA45W525_9RHOB|nr:NAD(P)H-binding protein [Paracoccus saliphilus]WCR02141.1 NAD(P)H-binding protein [Paracoccus saliphilus]SIS90435.1 Nucleoside-diphosphate-sugar epimerase [Paracoccus saliphilus]
METTNTALVLGATGGIGGAIAAALLRHGWRVRGMARSLATARKIGSSRIEWIEGDAMRRADVMRAADGASIVVHAVNPPNYMNWDRLVLPMIDNTIAAASSAGARIVLPGTIYNFDPATTPVIDGDSIQRPRSRKGEIRVALEERLERAAPEVTSLILRAGDFFGPGVRSSWFAQAMISSGKPVRRILNPARGAGHSWAYLPDLAETFAQLVEVPDQLRPFEVVQFEGLHDKDGMQMVKAIRRVCGREIRSIAFPWWAMSLLAPFGGFPREAVEIAPYWRHPMRLDNTRLVGLLGAEPRTPLDEAVRASLVSMGCLGDDATLGAQVSLT